MNKAVIGAIVGVLVVSYVGAGMYATGVAEEKVNEFIKSSEKFGGGFTYEDISANPFGEVTLSDIKVVEGSETITVSTLVLDGFDDTSDDSAHIAVEATGVEFAGFSVDKTPDNPMEFIQHHLVVNNGELNFSLNIEMDGDDNIIDINELSVQSDDIGYVSFEGEVLGLAKAFLDTSKNLEAEDPEAALIPLMTIDKVIFEELTLSLSDDGLIEVMMAANTNDKMPDTSDVRDMAIESMERQIERTQGLQKMIAEGSLALLEGDGVSLSLAEPLTLSLDDAMRGGRGIERKLMSAKLDLNTF